MSDVEADPVDKSQRHKTPREKDKVHESDVDSELEVNGATGENSKRTARKHRRRRKKGDEEDGEVVDQLLVILCYGFGVRNSNDAKLKLLD